MKTSELKKFIWDTLKENPELLKKIIKEVMIESLSGQSNSNSSYLDEDEIITKVKPKQKVSESIAQPGTNVAKITNLMSSLFDGDDEDDRGINSYNNNRPSPINIVPKLTDSNELKVAVGDGKITINNNAINNAIGNILKSGDFKVHE